MDTKKTKIDVDEKIIATAKKRFEISVAAESEIRRLSREDLKFRAGDQWPEDIKRERQVDNRPCLVINRVKPSVNQITNDQRQNRPAIKVYPVDDNADIETAKVYQGMIRSIERCSDAEEAYDTAFEGAVIKGFGFWRINTKYISEYSFDQEAVIEKIDDDFMVRLDPYHKRSDGSDANWGFIFEDVPKDDFIAEYGESKLSEYDDWAYLSRTMDGWVKPESCRVAEYFYKEYKEKELVLLSDGRTVLSDDLKVLYPKEQYPDNLPEGVTIDQTRKTKVEVIEWVKTNGFEILERTTWPGKYIPIVPVYGDRLKIDGKTVLEGIVRHAKDPQRMYNYWKSTETETITLAPKAPYIAAEGQIPKQYEQMWKTANRKTHAYLVYKPTEFKGNLVPAPQRNVFEPPVAAITQASLLAADDLKSTTNIFDATLGNRSNENSGIAIQRRASQSQTSNFHYVDNLTRSIRHTGRILVDIIPRIYDTARAQRILGEEGDEETIQINELFERDGKMVQYNLGSGKYDVGVDVGPNFETKRQEAAASMEAMARSMPQLGQIAPDLLIKNMDWPGAQEIAERLKKTLPPEILDSGKNKDIPPQVKAQLDQMGAMVEQLSEALNQANEEIKQKRIEIESKERIEFAKMENDIEKEKLKRFEQSALASVNQQIADIEDRLRLLGINRPVMPQATPEIVNQGQQVPMPQGPGAGYEEMEAMPQGEIIEPDVEMGPDEFEPTGGRFTPGQSFTEEV